MGAQRRHWSLHREYYYSWQLRNTQRKMSRETSELHYAHSSIDREVAGDSELAMDSEVPAALRGLRLPVFEVH